VRAKITFCVLDEILKMIAHLRFFLAFCFLFLSGCGSSIASKSLSLDDSNWQVVAIAGEPLLAGAKMTMHFSLNKVSGSSGCNRYTSSYQSTSENIKFSEPVVTKMWCAFPEGVMRQEAVFLKQLPEVERYSYEGSRLTFKRFNGEAALTLSKN
jgi:heat shock protein HslJ